MSSQDKENAAQSSPKTRIMIVRHGESQGNINRLDPDPDPDLTEDGITQVGLIAQALKGMEFHAIYCSDYIRARKTAEILNKERKLAIFSHKIIRERDFGSLFRQENPDETQRLLQEINESRATLAPEEFWNYRVVEDMETEREAVDRFLGFLKEVAAKHPSETILIVGHGNLMRSLLVHLGYATFQELPPFAIKNTGYIRLETDGENFDIVEVEGIEKIT